MPMIECVSLTQSCASGGRELTVLDAITFALEASSTTAIVGPAPVVPRAALVTLAAGLAAGSGLAGVRAAAEASHRTSLELLRAE